MIDRKRKGMENNRDWASVVGRWGGGREVDRKNEGKGGVEMKKEEVSVEEREHTIVLTGNMNVENNSVNDESPHGLNEEKAILDRLYKVMGEKGGWIQEDEKRLLSVKKIMNRGGVVRAMIVKCGDKKVRDDVLKARRHVKNDQKWWVNKQMTYEERDRERRARAETRHRRYRLMNGNIMMNRNMYERGGRWAYG
jgi:hypothetical protein